MVEPPELWAFAITNLLMFGFGGLLTGLSYFAYRADRRQRSLRNATAGFGLITIGGLVEPVYQLGVKGDYHLGGRELLALQSVEAIITAIGLGLLFYSVYLHNDGSRQKRVDSLDRFNDSR